jgi:hypothetical protein
MPTGIYKHKPQQGFQKGHQNYITEEVKRKISIGNKGKMRSEETKRKISISKKEKRTSIFTEFKKGHEFLGQGKTPLFEKGHIPWSKGKKLPQYTGKNSHHWKGGITPLHEKIRHSLECELWRKAIYKRDNWTCILCGNKNKIHAHHIKSFAKYPELRFAIDNGITLCENCHKDVHKASGRKFTKRN